MLEIEQATLFDYASLDADTRVFVQEKAQAIHTRLKRTAEDIIAIGLDLMEVKARLPHGQFIPWLQSEFDMSRRIAHNFMAVAQRFGDKSANFAHLAVSVLYELAAPSTPDTVIEMVESGQIPPAIDAIREAKHEVYEDRVSLAEIFDPVGNAAPSAFLHSSNTNEGGSTVLPPVEIDRGLHHEDPLPIVSRGVPAALQMSESNEWYTPSAYVEAARELMGGIIDVDPASNEYANSKVVQATTYYDITTNGLDKKWTGRVWLNPPYGRDSGDSNQETWSAQLLAQFNAGITTEAVLLVNAVTDRKWFQPLWQFPICFTNHRIRFYNTEVEAGQPTHGNALIYFGPEHKTQKFIALFKQFGPIVGRIG